MTDHVLTILRYQRLLHSHPNFVWWSAAVISLLLGAVALAYSLALSALIILCVFLIGPYSYFRYATISEEPFFGHERFNSTALKIVELNAFRLTVEDIAPINIRVTYRSRFGLLRAQKRFLLFEDSSRFLLITPQRYWYGTDGGRKIISGALISLAIRFLQKPTWVHELKHDEPVLHEEWQFVTKYGERDLRYKDNPLMYQVKRYWASIRLPDDREIDIGAFTKLHAADLYKLLSSIITVVIHPDIQDRDDEVEDNSAEPEHGQEEGPTSDDHEAVSAWYEILEVSSDATLQEIDAAYRSKIKQYHPDLVANLGIKLREIAEQETKNLNSARDKGRPLHI